MKDDVNIFAVIGRSQKIVSGLGSQNVVIELSQESSRARVTTRVHIEQNTPTDSVKVIVVI